jgi:hypothetical protein
MKVFVPMLAVLTAEPFATGPVQLASAAPVVEH